MGDERLSYGLTQHKIDVLNCRRLSFNAQIGRTQWGIFNVWTSKDPNEPIRQTIVSLALKNGEVLSTISPEKVFDVKRRIWTIGLKHKGHILETPENACSECYRKNILVSTKTFMNSFRPQCVRLFFFLHIGEPF
jgi:hypothetical protein